MNTRLGPDCLRLAIILGTNATLISIMITFLIVVLNRYRFTDDDKAQNERDNKEIEMQPQQEHEPVPKQV